MARTTTMVELSVAPRRYEVEQAAGGFLGAEPAAFAQAEDSYGVFGDPVATTLTLQ